MKFSNSVLSRGVRDLKKPETNIIWLALGCLVKKDLRDVNEEKRRTGGQDGGSGSRKHTNLIIGLSGPEFHAHNRNTPPPTHTHKHTVSSSSGISYHKQSFKLKQKYVAQLTINETTKLKKLL